VDKHAPSHFCDLLSNERTKREVLRALRAWDPYVFGKDAPRRPSNYQKIISQNSGKYHSHCKVPLKTKYGRSRIKPITSNSPSHSTKKLDKRPEENERVILLSGAPGVGKTTLAHIVASHAGYRPLEVNASDERSVNILPERIIHAMESSTLNINNDSILGKPNCLILDEIDGVDAKNSINAIVDIIKQDLSCTGKTKVKPYLRRPIIFICNHKHSPSLRPLLPWCRQFDVIPPKTEQLVARLESVLRAESMILTQANHVLRRLVERMGGDIRSCLHSLQFASGRARELHINQKCTNSQDKIPLIDLTSSLMPTLTGSTKDERGDVAETIGAVFRKPQRKQERLLKSSPRKDVESVVSLVECYGEHSKTLDCMFLNILSVSYVDPTLEKCWSAHEWISEADIYRSYKTGISLTNSDEYRVMQKKYIPNVAGAIHLLCRIDAQSDLTYTTRPLLDMMYHIETNWGVIGKMLDGLTPATRRSIIKTSVACELLPFWMILLSAGGGPGMLTRAVSSFEMLNEKEKKVFETHVALLRALGLSYVKVEHNWDDNSEDFMRLEPEIGNLIQFKDIYSNKKSKRTEIPSVVKELLAHAVNLENMRWRELEAKSKESCLPNLDCSFALMTKDNNVLLSSKNLQTDFVLSVRDNVMIHNANQLLADDDKTIMSKKRRKHSLNFLGVGATKVKAARAAHRKATFLGIGPDNVTGGKRPKLSNTGSRVPITQVIRYKFQKGFSQAIRMPCRKEHLF